MITFIWARLTSFVAGWTYLVVFAVIVHKIGHLRRPN